MTNATGQSRVFLSATSADLKAFRQAVRDFLLDHQIFPVVQEHFPADHRELTTFLRDCVAPCDAFVCLVGRVYGAEPDPPLVPRRSYTQLEYDTARQLNKPVYVFLFAEEALPACTDEEPAELQELQRRHREALLRDHKCEIVATREELLQRLSTAIPQIMQAAGYRPMFYLHPPTPPAYFAGRHAELQQLQQALRERKSAVIAVVGMGGQGKTTLARQAIEDFRWFPFAAAFWCTAYRAGFRFDVFLDELLQYLLGGNFNKREMRDLPLRIDRALQAFQERPTLVVVDGIEQWLQGWNSGRGELQSAETMEQRKGLAGVDAFLSGAAGLSNGSHLLITTRALPAVLDQRACTIIPMCEPGRQLGLEGLDDGAAVRLLEQLGVQGSADELRRISQSYGNHPLALEVLAGLLVNREGGRIEAAPTIQVMDAKQRLFQLFDVTRRSLPGGRTAERYLQIAAHFLENPSLDALGAVASPSVSAGWPWPFRRQRPVSTDQLRDLLVTLAHWNLLKWDGERRQATLHPLVKEFFGQRNVDSRKIHARLADYYRSFPDPDAPRSLRDARCRLLAIEHGLRAGNWQECVKLLFGQFVLQHNFVEWLAEWGHLVAAESLLGSVAADAQGLARGELLSAQGALLRELGELKRARRVLDQAIEVARQCVPEQEPGGMQLLGSAHMNRGNVLRQSKRFHEALSDYEQALAAFRKLAEHWPSTVLACARALSNHGNLERDFGNLGRAERDYEEAILLYERWVRDGGELPVSVLPVARLNRAITLIGRQKHRHALSELSEVVETLTAKVKEGHSELQPTLAYACAMRGMAYFEAGEVTRATTQLTEAVQSLQTLVDEGRRDVEDRLLLARLNLAQALVLETRWKEATAQAQTVLDGYDRLLQAGRSELEGHLARAHLIRAQVAAGSGDWSTAASHRETGLGCYRRLLSDDRPDLETVYLRMAYSTAQQLLESSAQAEAAGALIGEILDCIEQGLQTGLSEAVHHEGLRILASLSDLAPDLQDGKLQSRVQLLQNRMQGTYSDN